MKQSEELISQDKKSNVANYKFTYSVEMAPVCKDDLVVLNPRLARSLSDINPLVLCNRISNNVNFIDFNTLKGMVLQMLIF